jgi:hypothetical protein
MLQKLFIVGPPLCVMGFPARNPPSLYKTRAFSFSKVILDKNENRCIPVKNQQAGGVDISSLQQ